MDRNPI